MTTFAPVPGSPTPRELAVADGSARKYRIGPWSSWGVHGEFMGSLWGIAMMILPRLKNHHEKINRARWGILIVAGGKCSCR